MNEAPETSDGEQRLDEARAEHCQAVESGRPPDRREFLAGRPRRPGARARRPLGNPHGFH
jgi:hypothetical protein